MRISSNSTILNTIIANFLNAISQPFHHVKGLHINLESWDLWTSLVPRPQDHGNFKVSRSCPVPSRPRTFPGLHGTGQSCCHHYYRSTDQLKLLDVGGATNVRLVPRCCQIQKWYVVTEVTKDFTLHQFFSQNRLTLRDTGSWEVFFLEK